MAKGKFTAQPDTIDSHAARTSQRATQLHGHAQGIGSTSLSPTALSSLAVDTGTKANGTYQHASSVVAGMSNRMNNISSTEKTIAGNYRETESSSRDRFDPGKVYGDAKVGNRAVPSSGRGGGSTSTSSAGGASTNNQLLPLNGGKPLRLGTHDEPFDVGVNLDDHQMKHQVSPIPGFGAYSGGKGEKFPSYVDQQWHEKYFGPKAAAMGKQQYDAQSEQLRQYRQQAQQAAEERDNLKYEGQAMEARIRSTPKGPERDQLMQQYKDLGTQYKQKQQEADTAAQRAQEEDVRLKNTVIHIPKEADGDNVKYDATMQWDADKNQWDVTYHNNPNTTAAEAASDGRQPGKTWWNEYGKKIANDNGLPGRN